MMNFPVGHYMAVGRLCAVDFNILELGIDIREAITILYNKGFVCKNIDMSKVVGSKIGVSKYKQRAIPKEAPRLVNCRTIIKWAYAQKGIWLPPHIQRLGIPVSRQEMCTGDLVFINDSGAPSGGHVGMAIGKEGIIVHANRLVNLVTEHFAKFVTTKEGTSLRCIRRIMLHPEDTYTFWCPPKYNIEWSGDIASLLRRGKK